MKIAGAILSAVLLAAPVTAQEGVNLSWDDCGTHGTALKSFACNSNEGADVLVASFVVPYDLPKFVAAGLDVDVRGLGEPPDWWRLGESGCRPNLAADYGGTSCAEPLAPFPLFMGTGSLPSPITSAVRIRAVVGLPPLDSSVALAGGVETLAAKIVIHHLRTVQDGSLRQCQGCQQSMCLVLNQMQLVQKFEEGYDPLVAGVLDRNFVTWQSDVPQCPESTPARKSTWGAVKALYR